MPAQTRTKMITAPEHLGLESRNDFRKEAVSILEQLPEGDGRLVIDLGSTRGWIPPAWAR